MSGPGFQAGQMVTMQQLIHPVEAVGHIELFGQDALGVLAAQGAAPTVRLRGTGGEALDERRHLLGFQLRLRPPTPRGDQTLDALIAVRVAPALNETPAAAQRLLDRQCRMSLDRQQCRPVAVALLSLPGLVGMLLKDCHIAWITFMNLHAETSVFRESFSMTASMPSRNPNKNLTRTRFAWDPYY